MEALLLLIVKDSQSSKQAAIRKAAQDAYDFLETQQGIARAPPHELRQICLDALQQALQSHNNKLMSHAVNGLQKLLRDDRFHSNFESENELQWLPSQVLHAVLSIQSHPDEIQVVILKVLLNMACTQWWSMNSKLIQEIFQLCLNVYSEGSTAVRTASQATASQTFRSFCNCLEEDAKSRQVNPFQRNNEPVDETACSVYEDVIPVFNFLCKKLSEYQSLPHGKGGSPLPLLLESTLTLVSCLPAQATQSTALLNFIWQKLCPSLIAFLGSPRTDKNIITSQRTSSGDGTEMGRGSGCLATAPTFTGAEAKMVYSIAVKLVELVGTVPSLRPMLESLFHRMLLYPPAQHRLEALKAVREVLRSPEFLLRFAGPVVVDDNSKEQYSDLSLLTLVLDSIVESSQCSESSVCYASVACVVALLGTLEQLCIGQGISTLQMNAINKLYKDLPSSDYTGPLTYKDREEHLRKLKESHNKEINNFKQVKPSQKQCKKEVPVSDTVSAPSLSNHCPTIDDDEDLGYQGDQEDLDVDSDQRIRNAYEETKRCFENPECCDQEVPFLKNDNAIPSDSSGLPSGPCDDNESVSSGLTEGPEDYCIEEVEEEESDKSLDEAVKHLAEQEAARREKLQKTLLGEESGKIERDQLDRLCEARNEFAMMERCNARHFVTTLKKLLPSYLAIRSSIEVDEAMQEFSSKYCAGIYNQETSSGEEDSSSAHVTIINADGVYLATYALLTLNLKLIRRGYYTGNCPTSLVPLTEDQFVEEVHGSGVLVYLSTMWLSELYQQILQSSLLEEAGYKSDTTENTALINLLTDLDQGYSAWIVSISDLDGLHSDQQGGQLLSDYRRLEKAATNAERSPPVEAGMKFSRRLLTGCWESILEVLSILLNGKNACGVSSSIGLLLGMEVAKDEHRKARDAIASSLEGLQKAARLCNILGLQSRCGSIFAQLAAASCPEEDPKNVPTSHTKRLKSSVLNRPKAMRMHVSHAMSMEMLLGRGLELGSHSPDCWRHVFRCCVCVSELEHIYFSQTTSSNSPATAPLTKLQKRIANESRNSSQATIFSDCDDQSFQVAAVPVAPQVNLAELLQQSNTDYPTGIITNSTDIEKIICGLSQQIDRLFDDAASKLNLQALISFLTELCAASQSQLFSEMAKKKLVVTPATGSTHSGGLLLLYRLGDVMLKCVRSGRPLIHIMKAWSVVGPHFMEAACHKDRSISKKAVTCIHDIVTALLGAQSELPHFHFNEALFKPFENLLCLELCDTDVQDQIISSICEFVEGSTTEIRSGWRPLFGALRAVRPSLPSNHDAESLPESRQVHVVMDVFEAFLGTDNVLVFSNAAIDCILCLLKYVRGSAENHEVNSDNATNKDFQDGQSLSLDLCLASLKYLHRCSKILESMYSMPACPIFHAAHRIKQNAKPQFVDPVVPNLEFIPLEPPNASPISLTFSPISREAAEVLMRYESASISLDSLDVPSGILHVWYLLLEGLAGAVSTCEKRYQPYTMESLFSHLRGLLDIPGPDFGIYCVNHLLLPSLQSWLRRTSRIFRGWDNYAANFKQCCGLATDLVVDYITKLSETSKVDENSGVELMLKQLMLVMIECVAQPTESISRLGCACIRHAVVSGSLSFTSSLWELVCLSLHRACAVSLHSLHQLMAAFHTDSDNFYGDIGLVKVATRRDCTAQETERLQQLAHQVFLLDNQRSRGVYPEPKEEEDRSFIFLLYPPNVEHTLNPDLYIIRVPFRSLVVGLLSHLILIQSIGTLLLQGSTYIVPSLANVLLSGAAITPSDSTGKDLANSAKGTDNSKVTPLPGVLPCLNSHSLSILLDCLSQSYQAASDFDLRPGLKFLIQKVSQAEVAANLYKQAGASWTILNVTLLHLALHDDKISVENTKKVLASGSNGGTQENGAFPELQHPNSPSIIKEELMSLCELYVDLVLDKDGHHSQADKTIDQPIFFLIAQPDDFPEVKLPNEGTQVFRDEVNGDITREGVTAQGSIDSADSETASVTEDGSIAPSEVNDTKKASDSPTDGDGQAVGDEDVDKVYSVATQRDISTMMHEYKRRKHQHSMPSQHRERRRKIGRNKDRPKEPLPPEVESQKRSSILKDSEAHMKVCAEMLLSVFDLLCQLEDDQFKALLPATFPMVRVLSAHAADATLRQTVAEYLQRVANIYGFGLD